MKEYIYFFLDLKVTTTKNLINGKRKTSYSVIIVDAGLNFEEFFSRIFTMLTSHNKMGHTAQDAGFIKEEPLRVLAFLRKLDFCILRSRFFKGTEGSS